MDKFVIIPDVTCDLTKELREEFNIKEYIRGYVHINDQSLRTDLEWESISREEFYKKLSNKKNTVSSATASPEEYYQVFKTYVEEGYAVLSMSISSKISATYNVASSAAKRIKEDYPDCRVYCMDTMRMSGSFGLLVLYASKLQQEGKSFEETIAWLEENKVCVHQMGPIDDLTFIARRGKISAGKAFMGNLAGIKPLGDSNSEGYVTVLAKVKGIKKAMDATVEYVKATATNVEDQYLLIAHSDRDQYAQDLKEKLEANVKCKNIYITDVFGGCGTNIGPGMIGVYFLGNPISEECAVEKEILTNCIAKL